MSKKGVSMNNALMKSQALDLSDSSQAAFHEACEKIIGQAKTTNGIGTLKEKTIHAVLKNYYAPNPNDQEKRIEGFVADIYTKGEIIEIQTRNFNTMRKKLEAFLPLYHVTIVYPIPATKWLCWIDEETGELTHKRKSPKRGSLYAILPELYRIKMFLGNPRLHFILTFIDVEEYRLLNGWDTSRKRGATRHDGIPTQLVDELYLSSLSDFTCFLPDSLPSVFTTKDLQTGAKISQSASSVCLNILYHLGVVERIGKKGNAYLYKRVL